MGKGDGDYDGLETVSGLLFDRNIHFGNAHLENIFKKNHKYIPRSRPSSRLYGIFQVEKGERGRKTTVVWIPSLAYYSTITFILKITSGKYFKNHKHIPRSKPSSRLYDILQVEKEERGTGTTVDWIPSQAYYSTIKFILKMHI